MRVKIEMVLDIDTDRWSDTVETAGMTATEVREDVKADVVRAIKHAYGGEGLGVLASPPFRTDKQARDARKAAAQ